MIDNNEDNVVLFTFLEIAGCIKQAIVCSVRLHFFHLRVLIGVFLSSSDRYQNQNNMSSPTRQIDGPMFVRPGGTMQRENGAVSAGWNGPVSNREFVILCWIYFTLSCFLIMRP